MVMMKMEMMNVWMRLDYNPDAHHHYHDGEELINYLWQLSRIMMLLTLDDVAIMKMKRRRED